jgi:ankyrin repeat protein
MKTFYYNSQDLAFGETPANQFKLNLQAWVNEPNNEGYLPAHYACLYGNVEMLHYLEELGTNLLYKSNAGETLLHMCAQNNQLSPMLYLSTKDIDFNEIDREKETPLHQASGRGYTEIVNFLVALPQVDLNPRNHREETPLMLAVK